MLCNEYKYYACIIEASFDYRCPLSLVRWCIRRGITCSLRAEISAHAYYPKAHLGRNLGNVEEYTTC